MSQWKCSVSHLGSEVYVGISESRAAVLDMVENFVDNYIYEDKPCFELARESLIDTNHADINENDLYLRLTYEE